MSKQTMRVALLQMNIEAGDPDVNYRKAKSMLAEAVSASNKPDVVMLPEMWNTGYALDKIRDIADDSGKRTIEMMSAFCREHGVSAVAGSIAYKSGEQVSNTILVFDKIGHVTADYSKIHLFRLMEEEKHLAAGDKNGSFEIMGQKSGMMICYDIRFPELARKLALDGAKLLFVPAEWPKPRLHHWRTLLSARAIENQMYVLACNRVGSSDGTEFFGHSMIIDPWGEIVAEAGEDEAIIIAEIDLSLVAQVRQRIPVFEDRRPELY